MGPFGVRGVVVILRFPRAVYRGVKPIIAISCLLGWGGLTPVRVRKGMGNIFNDLNRNLQPLTMDTLAC